MTLLEAATLDGGIYLFEDCTLINLADGHSVMVVDARDFERVQDWIVDAPCSGIRARDINRFLALFPARITRPGSHIQSQGSDEALLRIGRAMQAVGMDVYAWYLPRVVRHVLKHHPVTPPAETVRKAA